MVSVSEDHLRSLRVKLPDPYAELQQPHAVRVSGSDGQAPLLLMLGVPWG